MSVYYITPACRILTADTYAQAQEIAKARFGAKAKARPIHHTGANVRPDYYVPSVTLDTYA